MTLHSQARHGAEAPIFESELIEKLIAGGEFSAQTWAREFMVANLRTPEMARDAETMLCWFAGAIGNGFERGRSFSLPSSMSPISGKLALVALKAQKPIAVAAGLHESHFDTAIAEVERALGAMA